MAMKANSFSRYSAMPGRGEAMSVSGLRMNSPPVALAVTPGRRRRSCGPRSPARSATSRDLSGSGPAPGASALPAGLRYHVDKLRRARALVGVVAISGLNRGDAIWV